MIITVTSEKFLIFKARFTDYFKETLSTHKILG